jgi:hypothetical protein
MKSNGMLLLLVCTLMTWVHAQTITSFTLVNASTGNVIEAFDPLADGDGDVDPLPSSVLKTPSAGLYGELKRWHRVTVAFEGPEVSETGTPNPFTDYRLDVRFVHRATGQGWTVPGYFAADGFAGESGSDGGKIWRVHFRPSEVGEWTYEATFLTGTDVAVSDDVSSASPGRLTGGMSGSFRIAETDKSGRDNRARERGLLVMGAGRYPRWSGSGDIFIKQGPDAPENLLAYRDFDGGFKTDGKDDHRVKTWAPHVGDWRTGDPMWKNGKGKGLIGAVNYLASEGMNAFSFLTLNIQGDDKNVFPYINYTTFDRIDVSRMDQWEVVFEHADRSGFFLHVKTQETENETLLDGGELGRERKLYYRELIARFGHHLALNWNLGEENNNQSDTQRREMAAYFHTHDPYGHLIVLHTYPGGKNRIYTPLLGDASRLTGVSLQGGNSTFRDVHGDVVTWVKKSRDAGRPWAVAVDEPGDAQHAIQPDDDVGTSQINGRKNALWGTLLGGGWGNEWYFGYAHANSDLTLEDFRSRDLWWDTCRIALDFFQQVALPLEQMVTDNTLSSAKNAYCFYAPGNVYLVYLKDGGSSQLDLSGQSGVYDIKWYNPRSGGPLQNGTVLTVNGGEKVSIGQAVPDSREDGLAVIKRRVRVAYIYGDVAVDGTLPSGGRPYDQMRLKDTGKNGLSRFREMVVNLGYGIEEFYDQELTLDTDFFSNHDVVIFGLHQKIWTAAEKTALGKWLQDGGGMLIYSDSASGGRFSRVGAQNPVGQTVVNNLISAYGMQVTVDQANGIKAVRSFGTSTHPVVAGQPELEGEGVSPVAVDPKGGAEVLIPYVDDDRVVVSGSPDIPHQQNITIQNPHFAALAVKRVGRGQLFVLFDRQPMWNSGPGSDISKRDNRMILERILRSMAGDLPDPL